MKPDRARIGDAAAATRDAVAPQHNFFASLVLAGLLGAATYCIGSLWLIQLSISGQTHAELMAPAFENRQQPVGSTNDRLPAASPASRGDEEIEQLPPVDPALRVEAGSGAFFRDPTVDGQVCEFCPEMVVVPAGMYLMGGSTSEPGRESWQKEVESPRTRVTIAQPFAVGRGAISFKQWDACVADGGCSRTPADNGWGRGELPVVNLSWKDAVGYAVWLSRKSGKSYRLMSEAEREYVARAGTATPFWFGAAASPRLANYHWDRTLPVIDLRPNPWGIFHVHGNVNEWTADCWNTSHQGHPGGAAPRLTGNCGRRVVKGGSWFNVEGVIRAASRSGLNADASYPTVGFRVARSIESSAQH